MNEISETTVQKGYGNYPEGQILKAGTSYYMVVINEFHKEKRLISLHTGIMCALTFGDKERFTPVKEILLICK